MLDLESLKVLQTVAEAGSFAKAAARLHKTQSSVSYQISKLEQQLNVSLFDRSRHRAVLTAQGQHILASGNQLLQQADSLQRMATQFADGWEARLELVMDGMLAVRPMLTVLHELSEQAIPTRVQFRIEFLGGVQQRFTQQQADMMLTLAYQPQANLIACPLAPLEVVLVCRHDHPLAQLGQVQLAQLQQHVELTVNDSSYRHDHAGAHTFAAERVFYLSDFTTKKAALLQGLGYGWMPMQQIANELAAGELREICYQEGSRHCYQPQLVQRRSRAMGKVATLLQQQLRQAYGAG